MFSPLNKLATKLVNQKPISVELQTAFDEYVSAITAEPYIIPQFHPQSSLGKHYYDLLSLPNSPS